MATLKKLNEERMSIISKLIKKEKDKNSSPVSPQFIKDFKDKILLENSALKLSIDDYKLMCRKDKVLNMMSIALNKPKDKLKKFCKYISVFEKNISKSPESIAHIINNPITTLPQDLRSIILDKFSEMLPTKYVLLDWIDKDKLEWMFLSSNPNAIDFLKNNQDNVYWNSLSSNPNPNAIKLLEERIKYENNLDDNEYIELVTSGNNICWYSLSQNPNAIKLLKKNYNEIVWYSLSQNSNPNAIKLLQKKIKVGFTDTDSEESVWFSLSQNPNAMEILKNNPDKIIWCKLSENSNPDAIKLLKERITYENNLSRKEYYDLEGQNKIDWNQLLQNPNAIDLLKENPKKINFNYLSANPKAIDLLKEQIKYENTLDVKEYKVLKNKINWERLSANQNAIDLLKENQDKIDWKELSANPNAIDLLKENKDKIDWQHISKNPNAIKLLKERIEYEETLTKTQYNKLEFAEKIEWYFLSKNPSIFKAI
jgi:hypothetical protein